MPAPRLCPVPSCSRTWEETGSGSCDCSAQGAKPRVRSPCRDAKSCKCGDDSGNDPKMPTSAADAANGCDSHAAGSRSLPACLGQERRLGELAEDHGCRRLAGAAIAGQRPQPRIESSSDESSESLGLPKACWDPG